MKCFLSKDRKQSFGNNSLRRTSDTDLVGRKLKAKKNRKHKNGIRAFGTPPPQLRTESFIVLADDRILRTHARGFSMQKDYSTICALFIICTGNRKLTSIDLYAQKRFSSRLPSAD